MPGTHTLRFEDWPIRVQHFVDGQLWFDSDNIARLLGYPDSAAALHAHCRPQGMAFGSNDHPVQLIDLGNVHRLVFHSASPRAERFEAWLSREALPRFLRRQALPSHSNLELVSRRLGVLDWQGQWWMNMNDVVALFGKPGDALREER